MANKNAFLEVKGGVIGYFTKTVCVNWNCPGQTAQGHMESFST